MTHRGTDTADAGTDKRAAKRTDTWTDERIDVQLAQWESRREQTRSRYAAKVTTLLSQRPELRGISPLADCVDEALRWAV